MVQADSSATTPATRKPIRLLTVAVVLTGLVLTYGSWLAIQSYENVRVQAERSQLVERLRGDLLQYDEILTMSARMAAATGDPKWVVRYKRHKPRLDAVAEHIAALAHTDRQKKIARQIQQAHAQLCKLEALALRRVDEGQRDAALQILSSDAYEDLKTQYASSVRELSRVYRSAALVALSSTRRLARWTRAFVAVVFLSLVVGWRVVATTMERWRQTLLTNNERLTRQAAELSQLNAHLDEQVEKLRQEVREREQAERRVQALNRMLRTMRAVSQLTARVVDRSKLLQEVCRTLSERRNYADCWVVLLDGESRPVEGASVRGPEALSAVFREVSSGALAEPVRKCLQSDEPVTATVERGSAGEPQGGTEADGSSSQTLLLMRLKSGERPLGVLAVGLRADESDGENERTLLEEAAEDVSFALMNIELLEQRARAEAALREAQQQLEQRVKERTAELARTNDELRREIAERLRAERTLKNSQALYASLVENLPVHVLRKDVEGRFTFANRMACEFLGRTLEELVGKTDFDLFPEELAEKYRRDDQKVLETGQLLETVEENRRGDEVRYMHVMKSPVRDAAGRIVGVQVVFWDVTERREAEAALEQERYLLHALMDNLPHNIYFKDRESRFIRINKALAEAFGLDDASQAIGKTDFDFFTEEHAKQAREDELRIIETGEPLVDREEKETWWDGRITWATTTKMPLYDEEGHIVGTFGISRDITAQRETAEALRLAKEAAEAASRAKSEFLANVSHEVRTPMNAIIGMTELLLDTELTETQREYLQLVLESAESLLALINDILDFSKIEAGKLSLSPHSFRLRESLGDAMKALAVRAHGKGLELTLQVDSDVPELVTADEQRIRQVLVNLTSNAIKFTEKGEVDVRVSCVERCGARAVLQFAVRDTGIGIPEDRLEAIFEKFVQVDSSTTRKYGGTGLGLAISSRLVELMDGRIWVESHLGQGSTFYFTVPVQCNEKASQTPPAPFQGLNALLVDDNPTSRRAVADMLSCFGMDVVQVGSASEAQEALRRCSGRRPFDLVVCDSKMPGTDGFRFIQWLRDSTHRNLPVLMLLTTSDRSHDVARCRQLGVEAYVSKPVKQSDLWDAVAVALEKDDRRQKHERASLKARAAAVPPLKILLAEDSLVNQRLAVDLLTRWGHTVTVANTGVEAVGAATAQRFDVIFMDVQMPEMDGFTATATIRQFEEQRGWKRTPVVAMTAHAMRGDRERCLEAGMDYYVAKPIRMEELLCVLEKVAASAGKTGSASRTAGPDAAEGEELVLKIEPLPVDWSLTLERLGGDQQSLQQLARLFRQQEGPQLERQFKEALARADSSAAARAAHQLKSAAGVFSPPDLVRLAAEVERAARESRLDDARNLWSQLQLLLKRLYAALDRLCGCRQ